MTAATLNTATEGSLFGIVNEDLVNSDQDYSVDLKYGVAIFSNTTDQGFTGTVDLWNQFGIKRFLGVKGFSHTTEDSVIVTENPTTTVDNGILTLTVPSGTDNDKRVYLIIGV